MDSSSCQDSIQVVIRVRPSQQQQSVLAFTETQIKLDKHQFAFDKIFQPNCTQNDVFQYIGNKLLNNVMDGYNSCVFAYGQTGSGKTHTMIGQNNGLMQRSFKQLFSKINRLKNAQCLVTCSYFQLYNEQIMDLLDPKKEKKLHIRQDVKKGMFVQNLTQQTVLDCDKLLEILYTGMKNRHIGETLMNRQSSRSHSVFTISLSCKMEEDGKKILKTPKLHFVDLAGSERQKMTQASGDRLKQAGNINKSLTTLGMVINALTSQKPRTHIPYRDSKLTCLLRDSLGGNSKTIIIATVSCASLSFQQTLSTLNFANRAKMVKVKALINEQSLSTNIEAFKDQIKRLKAQIMKLKNEPQKTPAKHFVIQQQQQQFTSPKQLGLQFQHHFQEINKKIASISDQLSQGITSPSLEAILSNITNNKFIQNKPYSSETLMQEQNETESNAVSYQSQEFIQYLNSNYELLTAINAKVNEYLTIKDELRNAAMNKKLSIQSLRTPSKFERNQYEQLLNKREDEIRILEQKLQQLQDNLNISILEKKDVEKKISLYLQKDENHEQMSFQYKQLLISAQHELQVSKTSISKLQSQLLKSQKVVEQLQIRLQQTKQLYLYSQQKYQNQKYSSQRLILRIKQLEQQLHCSSKMVENVREQMSFMIDQSQKLKLLIEQKQSHEQQLENSLTELEQTLQFNKRMIQDMTKRSAQSNKQLLVQRQEIEKLIMSNKYLEEEKELLMTKLESQRVGYEAIIEQKTQALRQATVLNDKLSGQLQEAAKQLVQHQQKTSFEIERSHTQNISFKRLLGQKDNQLVLLRGTMYQMQQKMCHLKRQGDLNVNNWMMKLESKQMQLKMIETRFEQYRQQSQVLLCGYKKQGQIMSTKNIGLQQGLKLMTTQYQQLKLKYQQGEYRLKSISQIFEQNDQLKKSYKQLVKQNYRLKGTYKIQEGKQKNEQLIAKVQYYEEKFRLMSLQYKNVTQIVKKLKQKQLESNTKLQFYEQTRRLNGLERIQQHQKDIMIRELKQQNRQLKCRLDNFEGNVQPNEKPWKQQGLKLKLSIAIKKWGGTVMNESIQQLLNIYGELIQEQMNKYQTVSKGIRRQQKLKAQNHFILKQNIYLKQRIDSLEGVDKTRKLIKQ